MPGKSRDRIVKRTAVQTHSCARAVFLFRTSRDSPRLLRKRDRSTLKQHTDATPISPDNPDNPNPLQKTPQKSRQTDGGYDWGLTDKCGQCFEVMCIDGHTRGLDWSELGPWGGCVEPGVKSVTVKISDSCPCHHPNSGNKRWCCGDRVHLDLSYVAFDSIAMRHRGVVDLKVRPADCAKQGVVAFYQ